MKKKFLLGAVALASAIALASCDSAATITDASGNTINVTKTNDSEEVAKALDALGNVKSDTSNITGVGIKQNVYLNIDSSKGELYTKLMLNESGDLYTSLETETNSLADFYLNSNIKLNYDSKEKGYLGAISTTQYKIDGNVNAFNQDKQIYASWNGLDIGDKLPSEAKVYLSYSTLKILVNNIIGNVDISSSNDISELDKIFSELKEKFDTKTLCEKLGITISSTSSNEVEFSINSSIKDLYEVINEIAPETASKLTEMVEIIGNAKIILNFRINVVTNLLVKIEAKTEGVKEAMQNALNSDENTKDSNVNAADMNFKLEFDYNAKKPTLPDTKDYVDIKTLGSK